jgi:hypothetical protein
MTDRSPPPKWQLSEAVRREPPRVESNSVDGSNVAAATSAATPVSKGKRLIKTPDSLDKWPRKKNRALMSRSPTPTSAVPSTSVAAAAATDAELNAVRPSAANETAAVGQRRGLKARNPNALLPCTDFRTNFVTKQMQYEPERFD